MPIIHIDSIADERVACFAQLTEAQLRHRLDPSAALIIVESPKVIRVALQQGLQPVALLCEERHITGDAADIIQAHPALPVYTGTRALLSQLTGYTLTRGVLCAMRRPSEEQASCLCQDAKRVAIIDSVVDATNIGAIFRSAAALGVDVVLLTRTACDPFNRRAIRVSMGSVFLVPWAWIDRASDVQAWGIPTIALALDDKARSIADPALHALPRAALILGTEGEGLAAEVVREADFTACIPMQHGVDSLNVAAASAVAFWEFCRTAAR